MRREVSWVSRGVIRGLFVAAALLASGLAYTYYYDVVHAGSSTSANLPVQVTGSTSIACDIGPPYIGQIPAGAQRAGYTHCAVNLDFTQFSNANQFIDCLGASNPLLYDNGNDSAASHCDSNHYAIVSDGGTNVLQLSFLASDYANGRIYNMLHSYVIPGSNLFGPYTGWTVGEGYYVEGIWKGGQRPTYTTSTPNGRSGIYGPYFYTPLGGNPYINDAQWFEVDFDETQSDGSYNSMNGPFPNCAGCSPDPTPTNQTHPNPEPDYLNQYSTWGARLAGDGVSNIGVCFFIDRNTSVNGSQSDPFFCNQINFAFGPKMWTGRVQLLFPSEGPQQDPFVTAMTGDLTMLVRRYTIWTCANWRDNNQVLGQSPMANQCYPGLFLN